MGRLTSWPWRGAIVVAVVVSVMSVVALLRAGLVTDDDRRPRPAGTTTPALAVDPLETWQIRTRGFRTEGAPSAQGYLFPGNDPAALVKPTKPIASPEGLHDAAVVNQWVQTNQGIDARTTTLRLTISAAKRRVVLRDLRVVGLRCTTQPPPPRMRVDVNPEPGGRPGGRLMKVRLDEDATKVERPGAWSFPLTVTRGQTEVIKVEARVSERECEWRLRFEYSVDGVADHVEIMNGGQPFVTAPVDGAPDWTTGDALAFTRNRFPG